MAGKSVGWRAAEVPAPAVWFDPAYGNDGKFRAGITAEGRPVRSRCIASLLVWRPGEPPPPELEGERRAWRKAWARRVHSRPRLTRLSQLDHGFGNFAPARRR
jgi:hypothetical protein